MAFRRRLLAIPMALLAMGATPPDPHSHARPDELRVRHVDLDLDVAFDTRQLRGRVDLRIERRPDCPADARLVLDTRDLAIESAAVLAPDGSETPAVFTLGEADPILGTPLSIAVPEGASCVRVRYRTDPRAKALQWLEPAQTAGGERPFLFTQSQAIQARSWLPVQDSPAIRLTYTATVRVPEGLTAVMSADRVEGEPGDGPGVFRFDMPQPIPAYLFALAAGDLAFRPLGARTGVYAEPALVEKAADEFADTEAMVEAAERLFGPYRWGRYDILVLPPSFPFGGMENPKLTFATPTVLAGDKSLVALVAHELAHSWSGNLVTNATWRDFWLNEGFTTYFERRIIEEVYGEERARMEAVIGLAELRSELEALPTRDEILHINLAGRDPDDGMTRVPYEKGALLLATLEEAFGREKFDAFLERYFDRHAFESITTADFVADLDRDLFPLDPPAAARFDLQLWLERPGLPPRHARPAAPRLDAVDRAAEAWAGGGIAVEAIPVEGWTFHEWLRFLRGLPEDLPAERLAELDRRFRLTESGNSEILADWLRMATRAGYSAADGRLEEFLVAVGRRKFLMPLYGELARTPEGKERAWAIYRKARPRYHPIAADSVDRLLGEP